MARQAAVVLSAGKGTRMRSRTPKVLHRVCGREMVSLVVEAARCAGFDPIVVVVPTESQPFKEALGDTVIFAQQAEPLGSGHALLQARDVVEDAENVAVLYGDVPLVLPETLRRMARLHAEQEAFITLITSESTAPHGLGRIVRDESGGVAAIVEDSEADDGVRAIKEVNVGVYSIRSSWLWPNLASIAPSPRGEIFITDLVSLASRQGRTVASVPTVHREEAIGINTRVHLAQAETALRKRIAEHWMEYGVTIPDPASTYIEAQAWLGRDTVILPNTHVTGNSRVGAGCEIGPNTIVSDSSIGDRCRIVASMIEGSTVEDEVTVGPFAHVRPGCHLEKRVHLGNFAEVNRSRIGRGTKAIHFSYIGDADVASDVNVGAGTVTCNYDGVHKHKTVIEEGAFIGSDSMLVAPVTIGARSSTGAGSVVTNDVPPDSVVVGVPARILSEKVRDDEP